MHTRHDVVDALHPSGTEMGSDGARSDDVGERWSAADRLVDRSLRGPVRRGVPRSHGLDWNRCHFAPPLALIPRCVGDRARAYRRATTTGRSVSSATACPLSEAYLFTVLNPVARKASSSSTSV